MQLSTYTLRSDFNLIYFLRDWVRESGYVCNIYCGIHGNSMGGLAVWARIVTLSTTNTQLGNFHAF